MLQRGRVLCAYGTISISGLNAHHPPLSTRLPRPGRMIRQCYAMRSSITQYLTASHIGGAIALAVTSATWNLGQPFEKRSSRAQIPMTTANIFQLGGKSQPHGSHQRAIAPKPSHQRTNAMHAETKGWHTARPASRSGSTARLEDGGLHHVEYRATLSKTTHTAQPLTSRLMTDP
jgi:hypothetical protein